MLYNRTTNPHSLTINLSFMISIFSGSGKRIRSLAFFLLLFFFSVSSLWAQSGNEMAIRQVMREQQDAWNHGNLEGFMRGYWKDDSLMFVGSSGITYSWQTTLEHYKKNYPDTMAMGKLNFTLLHITPLAGPWYFVTGQWHLQRKAGDLGGYYTLLFKKIKGKWVIVVDHTS
jgi:ketosteroid isomerase-like protein